jgi:hypothetical protein
LSSQSASIQIWIMKRDIQTFFVLTLCYPRS